MHCGNNAGGSWLRQRPQPWPSWLRSWSDGSSVASPVKKQYWLWICVGHRAMVAKALKILSYLYWVTVFSV